MYIGLTTNLLQSRMILFDMFSQIVQYARNTYQMIMEWWEEANLSMLDLSIYMYIYFNKNNNKMIT